MQSFEGKVALITGGSSGIGLGLATALAVRGAKLALIGTHEPKLTAAVAQIESLGGQVLGVPFDVSQESQWPSLIDAVEAKLGEIDLLILNAGAITRSVPIEQTTLEEWRWLWDVNVNGVFYGLRACLPRLKQRRREAQILVTSSIGALIPRLGAGPYGASKAAVLALCEAVKLELEGGPVSIAVMCPAGVRTSFNETATRNAPSADAQTYDFMKPIIDNGMDPTMVGEFVIKCIQERRFYIFTHPGFKAILEPRYAAMLDGFQGSADPGSAAFGA